MGPMVRVVCEGCLRSVEVSPGGTDSTPSRCPHCGCVVASSSSRVESSEADSGSSRSPSHSQTTELGEKIDWHRAWERGTLGSLGRFQLRERLGDGGFGQVFLAYDPRLDRDVALKVLKQANPSERVVEWFFREARAVARLDHPNIVGVHDAGCEQGRCWVAYQLVSGRSLWWYRDRQPMDAASAARIIRDLADAVDHAHGMGVVHRDIKPANVIIDDRGRPRLIDFGLARRSDLESALTRDGAVVGTPAYMSPEQARGLSRQADERSDVYSLGVIFYELLAARRPHDPGTTSSDPPPTGRGGPSAPPKSARPRAIKRSIPVELDRICGRAMSANPADRYPTARALADELDHWLRRRQGPRSGVVFVMACTIISLAAALLVELGNRVAGIPGIGRRDGPAAASLPEDRGASFRESRSHDRAESGPAPAPPSGAAGPLSLVGNRETHLYHRSMCHLVPAMSARHRQPLEDPQQARAQGYRPCKQCRPPSDDLVPLNFSGEPRIHP